MIELLNYSFMQRALLAGVIIGLVAPLIGSFLVAKRYSLIADSLAHVSLAGVAVGVVLGVNPIASALVVAVVVAMVIEKLRAAGKLSGEMALAMFLSSGLAVAVVLIGLAKNLHVDLFSYLFGSITTVQSVDLWLIVPLGLAVMVVLLGLYKELSYMAFDDESAKVSGLPTRLLNQLLVVLAAVTVVVSLRVVGGLLVGALMVIPVAAAMQLGRSFKQTVVYAMAFGVSAVVIGLVAAFYLNLAAGGAIVLVALLSFFGAAAWRSTR